MAPTSLTPAQLRDLPGFLPDDEGVALADAVAGLPQPATVLELGTYCGKSTVYLARAVAPSGGVVVSVDHHRGSEEHQPGWEYHDERLVDDSGRLDTLPHARRVLRDTGAEEHVVLVVGTSAVASRVWRGPVDAVFLDGGHTHEAAHADYERWARWVRAGGALCIHDVFASEAEGGQAPREVHDRALASGMWEARSATGSLRVLRRITGDAGDPVT